MLQDPIGFAEPQQERRSVVENSMNRLIPVVASFVLPAILLSACANATESTATLIAAQAAPADAVTADPARYSVLFEKDVARLIRVNILVARSRSCTVILPAARFLQGFEIQNDGANG